MVKICGKEYTKNVFNQVTCPDKCRAINDRNSKMKYAQKYNENESKRLGDLSEQWRIPIMVIREYGESFLKENPTVIEALQLHNKLAGRYTFLTDEEKEIRIKSGNRYRLKKYRDKKGYEKKVCKMCGKEFIPGIDTLSNFAKTC